MTIQKSHNVGVRNHNPNVANAPAGSEGTVNPSATAPVVPSTPVTPVTPVAPGAPTTEHSASQLLGVEAEVKTCREGCTPYLAALSLAIQGLPSQLKPRSPTVSAARKNAAGLYAGLLREFPYLTSGVSAETIEAGLAVDAAMTLLKGDFQRALSMVVSGGREAAAASWFDAAMVRSAAKARPNKDPALVARLASIEALLRRGKRVTTTANAATKAQTAAAKAQQKAARAAAKAARKAQTAARTAQVHAENHPPTPDVVIVPAGTTPKG